ncbi:hypothetical protein [Mesorhizobium sp.]|uniref:hypothetical protein n=1 Tax=Mesorhizobium sp. TaxID=1871066 RepID=UPI000FE30A11|nr:hypothetical protein [Mesorhizobium sp.]RWK06515.1 MAG: hypothetical protein EOR42_10780 [Mesorhizobium sp.]
MSDDDDLDALEACMRRKLGALQVPTAPKFSTQEAAIAQRLLGQDNAETLQRRVHDGQRFRAKPVTVVYEYWFVDGGAYSMGHWQLARIENGRVTHQKSCDHDELLADVGRLRREGVTVREFKVGTSSSPTTRPKAVGGRKSFAERYGSLKIGGGR